MAANLGKYIDDQNTARQVKGVAILDAAGNDVGWSAVNPNANPTTIYVEKKALTASPVAFTSKVLANGGTVKADVANVGSMFVGPAGVSAATGWPLSPGESISYGVTNANAIYIVGVVGQNAYVTGN